MAPSGGLDDELPDEFEAVSPAPDETSSFEQEYHDYMDDVEQLSGLELNFTPDLPDRYLGLTIPSLYTGSNGNQIAGSDIWISDRYLDNPHSPANFSRYTGILHHELVHGAQFRNMALTPERFNEIEKSYLQFLHEGQASYNGDSRTYKDAHDLYGDFYEQLKAMDDDRSREKQAADLLEEFSAENYMRLFYLEDDNGDIFYETFVMDRDRADGMRTDEIYDLADSRFDAQILRDDGYTVDFQDFLVDTEKLGRHIVEVQEWIENYYDRLEEEDLALPAGATTNLGL